MDRYIYIIVSVVLLIAMALYTTSENMSEGFDGYTSGTHSALYVTTPNEEVAAKIARGLVKGNYAACVNIIPKITSIYMWKGEVSEDPEVLMMIKSRTSRVEEITKFVKENHPYEVCEVISLPIQNGNPEYLKWISDVVPTKHS